MKQKVTIKTIAKELGVSTSTVSKALKDSHEISKETKEKIQAYADLYNYKPNNLALQLRNQKTKLIGVILPKIVHHFFSTIIKGIEEGAHDKGYRIMVCFSDESHTKEVENLKVLSNGSVDGLIVSIANETLANKDFKHFQDLVSEEIPLVLLDRVVDEILCDKVVVDDFGAGYKATKHLLNTGCKKVAILTTPEYVNVGTLRRKGFSRAWDVFVQLGCTDDTYVLEGSESMTNRDFINSFLPYNENDSVELKLRHYLKIDLDDTLWDKLVWLDIFDDNKKIGIKNATPAQILQKILEEKWSLKAEDKDMIVMYHKFVYSLNNEFHEETSEMVSIGENQTYTSMSNTVGLPLGICVKNILNDNINMTGVLRPIYKEIYEPILNELEAFNIKFKEKEINPPRLYSNDQPWS